MKRASRSHLHVVAETNPGMTGKNNEDNYGVSAYHLSESDPTPVVFAVVSDGIGGHQAGEVAAEIVVNEFSQWVARSDGLHPLETLASAFTSANKKLLTEANADPRKQGLGATLACAWVIGKRLYTATAGDSRIYLVRANAIQQLSVDHTWVQEAIDKGIIDASQAIKHPNAHVIRRYLGSDKGFEPDFRLRMSAGESDERSLANQGLPLLPGDVVMLCSDGLTDLVSNQEIVTTMQNSKGMRETANALINLANARGGHDNITVVMLMMPWGSEKQDWYNH